jgi:hypothetical protein
VRQEREPSSELDQEIVAAYAATFISRFDRYPVQLPNGLYIQVAKPLTPDLIQSHLEGYRHSARQVATIGAYALDKQSRATWICFDADTDDEWKDLLHLSFDLLERGVPSYPELSRRGGHLWLFTPIISGGEARRFGQQLLGEAKISDIELYPKQDQLGEGAGSFVRLPLGLHRRNNRVHHFVYPDGVTPLGTSIREQIKILSHPARVPIEFIEYVLEQPSKTPLPSPLTSGEPNNISGENLSDRIKSRISVFDFVSHYVELDQRGMGCCPFHDDQHKSFGVNSQKNYWHCFAGCGGGSIIDFWTRYREMRGQSTNWNETIKDLADLLL